MGALIMTHSDDEGLVLPPALAPIQVVAVPIYKTEEDLAVITERINELGVKLKTKGISFKFDDDENRRPGWKFAEYEAKGVPVRLAMGMRDFENGNIEVARRDNKTKEILSFDGVDAHIELLLEDIQSNLYNRALEFRKNNIRNIDSYDEFKVKIESEGGFFLAHWDGTDETEKLIKDDTKATIRCIPFDREEETGECMVTGKPSAGRVIFAKAY
jgi:prolyl-tRNA synthetase